MGLLDFLFSKWKSVEEAFSFAKKSLLNNVANKTDLSDATAALDFCAERDDSKSQYYLYALEYDKAKQNNQRMNLKWLEKASNSNYAPAQYDLAIHYLYGEEIEQNTFKAIGLMEKSAEQGYEPACKTLIRLFKVGTKIRKSSVRAAYWLAKLENSSYCETTELLPFTEEMSVPEPKAEKKIIKKPISFDTFANLFTTVQQSVVIEANKNESFVINAGPGTGKTYTLIRKIENLVSKQGVDANEIVVLSFTNAVVKEVKDRLSSFADSGEGERSLRNVGVKTFHSFAYWLLKTANENIDNLDEWQNVNLSLNKLTYDDCMVYGASLMKKNPQIVENWQYFVVDEIQDINHGKAQFVLSILEACVKYNVPFCFLGDSCQAIYDYLDEKNSNEIKITSEEFYKRIYDITPPATNYFSFDVNHRSATKIQQQSKPVRDKILSEERTDFPGVVKNYRENLEELKYAEIQNFIDKHPDDKICIMERSNINTRFISSQMMKNKISHFCALSLQKGAYPQWIAKVFGGFSEDYLTRENLESICLKSEFDKSYSFKVWNNIQKELKNPSEIIPFKSVIYALLSHNLDEIDSVSSGNERVIVSNIHRTKGLEYDYVLIDDQFLRLRNKEIDEMKVLYVAITRAKKETLCLIDSEVFGYMNSLKWCNRHYRKEKITEKKYRHKYVEIINNDEISDIGPDSFILPDMNETQKIINSLKPNEPIELVLDEKQNNLYAIFAKRKKIGYMNESFTKGLNYINKNDYPPKFNEIYIDGVLSYIGSTQDYKPKFERKLQEQNSEYGKYRIWNYITFSGLAHAVYD